MNERELADSLTRRAAQEGLSPAAACHLHLLQGVVRRWAGSRHARRLVLGGSLLTQQWVGLTRRAAGDLDFVGLYPHDLGETLACFREALTENAGDGVHYDLDSLRGQITWADSPFPGTRAHVVGRVLDLETEVKIDVGFNYPLVPPASLMDYPFLIGPAVPVLALRPELMAAWKFDEMFERGPARWQPKGLFDVDLITRHVALDPEMLVEGIRVGFASKAIPLESVMGVLYSRAWWERPSAQARWANFRVASSYPVPEDLLSVAGRVARALWPALSTLIAFPPGVWLGEG